MQRTSMFERQPNNSSMHTTTHTKPRRRDKLLNKKKEFTRGKISITTGIGILLTLLTIVLQCVAFFTPHWKEISPTTHSLYVDGIDVLIRTEVLHYFNTIHRYSRHSYGLFQRCEYVLSNSSTYNHQHAFSDFFAIRQGRKCTKNYLPSYRTEFFNECHSLAYYQFCTKSSEKTFDIKNDYLRATFDISSSSSTNSETKFSCDCHYPPYVVLCRIIGILALIFLFLSGLLYSSFPFCTNPHYRLKIKCFGILASVLAVLLLMANLIIILQHLEYESIEYLIAVQRHYKSNQIYKLSQDTKIAVDRFLSSIQIRVGYSTILAWIAFVLAVIDGILLLATCKVAQTDDEKETHVALISSHREDHQAPLRFSSIPNDIQPLSSLLPSTVKNNLNETTSFVRNSQNDENQLSRRPVEDEV